MTMDLQTSITMTPSQRSWMTLSSCRRLQVGVLTCIFIIYLVFVVNIFIVGFSLSHTQRVMNSTEESFLSKNSTNISTADEPKNDDENNVGGNDTLRYNGDRKSSRTKTESTISYFYVSCLLVVILISTLSVAGILFIYTCIPELQNVLGKIIICYSASIMLYHISNMIELALILGYGMTHWAVNVFKHLGYTALYSWACWHTTLCFDIWYQFSRTLDAHQPHLRQGNPKFGLYFIGAGGSAFIVTIVYILLLSRNIEYSVHYGGSFCLFVVIINSIMFLATLYNLRFHKGNTSTSNLHGNSPMGGVTLYAKLSMFMGIEWLLGSVCALFFGKIGSLVGSLCVRCQGIFMFILLVCNKRVVNMIREHWK